MKKRVDELLDIVRLNEFAKRRPVAALRRPAAAGRARPCARQLPEGAPPRRAARRPRPEAPPGHAARAQAHPARGRHHLHLRHPRSGRGAHDERPDRGDERGERRADRHAARDLRPPVVGVRGRVHRPGEPLERQGRRAQRLDHDRRGRGSEARGRRTTAPASRSASPAPSWSAPSGCTSKPMPPIPIVGRSRRRSPTSSSRARSSATRCACPMLRSPSPTCRPAATACRSRVTRCQASWSDDACVLLPGSPAAAPVDRPRRRRVGAVPHHATRSSPPPSRSTRQMSRRRFLAAVGVGLGAAVLAPSLLTPARSRPTTSPSATGSPTSTRTTAATSAGPGTTIDEFEKSDRHPHQLPHRLQRQRRVLQPVVLADARPGQADRGRHRRPTNWMAARLIELGWTEKLLLDRIPNHKNLEDAYLDLAWDPGATSFMPWQARHRRHRLRPGRHRT